jgi:hypothetical protein
MSLITPPGYVQGGTYSAKQDRLYNTTDRAFADGSQVLSARQGFYGGRAPVFASLGSWNIGIGACAGIIANGFAAAAGDYEFANDATVSTSVAASSGTQNRRDLFGFQLRDNFYDGSGLNTVVPAVVQGAYSNGVASDPATPTGFIPVGRAVVDAGSTTPVLQSLIQFTTNDGGVLQVTTQAQRDAMVGVVGQTLYRRDKGFTETWDGTAWRAENGALVTALADVTSPLVSQLVTLVSDGITYRWTGTTWQPWAGQLPRFSAFQSVAQSIPVSTWTPLTFTSEVSDTANGHSTVTNTSRYVAPVAGVVAVTGGFNLSTGQSGRAMGISVYKNGSAVPGSARFTPCATTVPPGVSLAAPLFLVAVNDYVEVMGYHDFVGSQNTPTALDIASSFSLNYVGRI